MSALVSEEKQAGTAGQKQWVFLFQRTRQGRGRLQRQEVG